MRHRELSVETVQATGVVSGAEAISLAHGGEDAPLVMVADSVWRSSKGKQRAFSVNVFDENRKPREEQKR